MLLKHSFDYGSSPSAGWIGAFSYLTLEIISIRVRFKYLQVSTWGVLGLTSCINDNPNLNDRGEDVIDTHLGFTDRSTQNFRDTVYIPVYSDIYSEHRLSSTLLTATLSIRSTSLRDTTFINSIDYYDTQGKLVRRYIDRTLILGPMQSIDYVIDRDDTSGGTGANFLVTWGARRDTRPLFQAVMIGTSGQHGLSFLTEGISTSKKNY